MSVQRGNIDGDLFGKPLLQWSDDDIATAVRVYKDCKEKRRAALEPISKSPEQDNKAGELDETKKVLGMILPADEDATLPLYPGEEALDQPAP
jgi:hypothetical protein